MTDVLLWATIGYAIVATAFIALLGICEWVRCRQQAAWEKKRRKE